MTKPEPKYTVNMTIPYSLAERLDAVTKKLGISKSALIRKAIEDAVASAEGKAHD